MSLPQPATPVLCVSTGLALREAVACRLEEVSRSMEARGLRLQVECAQAGAYVLYACLYGGQPPAADAWGSIVRCHVAVALAGVAVGPLAQRWLTRRVVHEARRHRLFLPPAARPKAVHLARQLVEGPPGERATPSNQPLPGHGAVHPGTAAELTALLASTAARPGLTGNLARWEARISRCLLEALGGPEPSRSGEAQEEGRPAPLSLEGVVRFRIKEFVRAIDRAAACAVAELLAERDEQRMFAPWRSLWLGPPPRLYEVHICRDGQGTYRLLDRWGEPAGCRTGDPAAAAATEDVLVSQLMRLGPRRIVVHLEPDDPGQAAVRGAFPGRVHACRGCPRCARARQKTPQRPG